MPESEKYNSASLGIYLNLHPGPKARDWPAWTNHRQQEKWGKEGLILWDTEAQLVTRISTQQAISLLNHWRNSTKWQEHGFTVGEPVWQLSLNNPEEKARQVLQDPLDLSPQQAQALFDYLRQHEEQLKQMAAAEEQARNHALNQVYDRLIELAERGKHTIYDETLSWEENKKRMRTRWESGDFPVHLTFTEQRLCAQVWEEIRAERECEERKKQERIRRVKSNLQLHHFFWERIKTMWPYLKAGERLHILQLLGGREWNQQVTSEIKKIVANAQFFETVAARMGTTPDVERMTRDELDLLFDLKDDALFNELIDLYRQEPTASSKEKPQDKLEPHT